MDKIYTIEETADVLSLNVDTIRKLIRKGDLKASMVTNKYRIPGRSIDEFMRKNCVQSKKKMK